MSKQPFLQQSPEHVQKEPPVPVAELPRADTAAQRRRLIWLILFISALITLALTVICGYFALNAR